MLTLCIHKYTPIIFTVSDFNLNLQIFSQAGAISTFPAEF